MTLSTPTAQPMATASPTMPAQQPTAAPFRLVTLGDSITAVSNACGAGWPAFLTRPAAYNAGIGGNTTTQMLARLDSDVLAHSPTDVTILGGANDIYYGFPLAQSMANLGQIVDRIQASGARAWLLTIPPYASKTRPHPGAATEYNKALRSLAKGHHAGLVDVWALLSGPGGGWLPGYTCDGIHPTATVAAIIARTVQATVQ